MNLSGTTAAFFNGLQAIVTAYRHRASSFFQATARRGAVIETRYAIVDRAGRSMTRSFCKNPIL
ncbi:hypothetical protein ABF87_06125 [Nitrosomonas sp. JL21]|nr:hypothetical protein [Nitrosomonas sp. JL21]